MDRNGVGSQTSTPIRESTQEAMRRSDCKGSGRIVLFTSVADCDCRKPVKILPFSCDVSGMEALAAAVEASIRAAARASGLPVRFLRGE